MRELSALRAVRRLAALALCSASCATPTMTVDVVEAPELVDGLSGTLVYVDHPKPLTSTAFMRMSHIVLVEPKSGASVRRPLDAFRPAIGNLRDDATVRMGNRVLSLRDGTSTPDDSGLGTLREGNGYAESIVFAPRGPGVVVQKRISERPATSSEPKREAEDRVLVRIGDRTHVRSGGGVVAWSPDGERLLHHAEDGLFEFRATGEPTVRHIADHSNEPVAIGYFEGEPCMALSAKWHPGHEHALPAWPLRTLELPGLYAQTFQEIAPGRVLYESLPTNGRVARNDDFGPAVDTWLRALRVCDPASGRTLTVNDRYDDYYGPFLVGYSDTTIAELGLAD